MGTCLYGLPRAIESLIRNIFFFYWYVFVQISELVLTVSCTDRSVGEQTNVFTIYDFMS